MKAASEHAERVARANIDECVVGVGGPHIFGLNTNGGFDLGSRMREITREDVKTAVERARAVERPPDREILHLLPRQFIVDDQPGIFDPIGMIGARLEVDLHIATCSGSAFQSTITCANRAGLEVTEAVLESIAAAEATLSADERELGVCLLNIGAHSTDLVVFFEGGVAHTAAVPMGGAHFTNDLAIWLHMPVAQAEELKRQYGHSVVTAVPQDAEIEITNPDAADAVSAAGGGDSGTAGKGTALFRERELAPGRGGGSAGRGLRSYRRRGHAAGHAGPGGEPVTGAGADGHAGAAVEYARRAGQSHVFHRDRHAAVCAPHAGVARF